jgi:hypothetical protein
MEKLNSETALRNAIQQLEEKHLAQAKALTEQFHEAYESLKPINLIKSTIKEATASIDLKDNLLNTSIGLTAGFLSKKLFESVSKSPLKRLIGSAIMFGITNLVAKNPETVKALGLKFLNAIKPSTHHRNNGVAEHQPGINDRVQK